jgi:hypothetical protein
MYASKNITFNLELCSVRFVIHYQISDMHAGIEISHSFAPPPPILQSDTSLCFQKAVEEIMSGNANFQRLTKGATANSYGN